MMIKHEEARRFIQVELDDGLSAAQRSSLESHLATCPACQSYSDSMRNMEVTLHPLLKRQWTRQPMPLPIAILQAENRSRFSESTILATRIAAIGLVLVAFMMGTLQFSTLDRITASPAPSSGPAIAPAAYTSTLPTTNTTTASTCVEFVYVVGENDTLSQIASQLSADKGEIAVRNNLTSERVSAGMHLIVPVCTSTPTGTLNAVTTALMPGTQSITSTPTGY